MYPNCAKKLRFSKEEKRRKVEFSDGCGAKSIAVDFELKRGGFLQDYANLRFVLKIGRLRNKILNKRY